MGIVKLEEYIHLLDRMLEREGLAEVERDEIFNYHTNIELISTYFDHKKHPSVLIKKLDRSPVQAMYASIDEAKKKPTTKKGKKKKFKKVMGEFGKGKLRPYHGKRNLRSKKQSGSKKEHKQALAIAFSEAGIKEGHKFIKENIENIENMQTNLTPGQQYAIDFLKPLGLTLISTPKQVEKGNLTFEENDKTQWAITKTGYVRKMPYKQRKWNLIYSYFQPQWEMGEKKYIGDNEYIELTHILSEKIGKSRKAKPEFRISYVNRIYKNLANIIDKNMQIQYNPTHMEGVIYNDDIQYNPNTHPHTPYMEAATKREVEEAVKKLYNKYIKEKEDSN